MTYYWCSISERFCGGDYEEALYQVYGPFFHGNNGSMSCLFWDIQCRNILRPWNPSQGSIKVIEIGTIR